MTMKHIYIIFMHYSELKNITRLQYNIIHSKHLEPNSGFKPCNFESSDLFIACLPVLLVGFSPDVMMRAVGFVSLNRAIRRSPYLFTYSMEQSPA